MRHSARILIAVALAAALAVGACNSGGGGGGDAAVNGQGYSLASLAGGWNVYDVNKGVAVFTIYWDDSGKITKWLNPDCASGKVLTTMTFTVTSAGVVEAKGKAWCSENSSATAKVQYFSLVFKSATVMKGSMGIVGGGFSAAFYKK